MFTLCFEKSRGPYVHHQRTSLRPSRIGDSYAIAFALSYERQRGSVLIYVFIQTRYRRLHAPLDYFAL